MAEILPAWRPSICIGYASWGTTRLSQSVSDHVRVPYSRTVLQELRTLVGKLQENQTDGEQEERKLGSKIVFSFLNFTVIWVLWGTSSIVPFWLGLLPSFLFFSVSQSRTVTVWCVTVLSGSKSKCKWLPVPQVSKSIIHCHTASSQGQSKARNKPLIDGPRQMQENKLESWKDQ